MSVEEKTTAERIAERMMWAMASAALGGLKRMEAECAARLSEGLSGQMAETGRMLASILSSIEQPERSRKHELRMDEAGHIFCCSCNQRVSPPLGIEEVVGICVKCGCLTSEADVEEHKKGKHTEMKSSQQSKVVYNGQFGGFGITRAGLEWLVAHGVHVPKIYLERARRSGVDFDGLPRHHPLLVQMVEELGERAGKDLRVRVLKGTRYRIDVYDGAETVWEPEEETWIDATAYPSAHRRKGQ